MAIQREKMPARKAARREGGDEIRGGTAEGEPATEIEENGEDEVDVEQDRWGPIVEDGLGEGRHGELRVGTVWMGGGFGGDGTGSIAGRQLTGGMKSFEEGDEGGGFSGAEIFAIGGHVATALNDLANELVLGEEKSDFVEGGAAFAAFVAERMAIVALLELKDEGALAFEGGTILQELLEGWDRRSRRP